MVPYLLFVLAVYCLAASSPECRVIFAWYDLWVGAFYDRKRRVLYILLVPCVGIEWRLPR